MKTYYICAALIFIAAYACLHFGFRKDGAEQIYRINDRLAFEVQPEDDNYNGITIHGYQPANKFICLVCGEFERDDSSVWMVNVKYRSGDWIYTDFPQHEQAKTDLINLQTGEAIEVDVPAGFKYGDDFAQLPEYKAHGLVKAEEFKLTQGYIKADFQPLSSYTTRCAYAHFIFALLALFLAFPKLILWTIDAFIQANDPSRPENYYGG